MPFEERAGRQCPVLSYSRRTPYGTPQRFPPGNGIDNGNVYSVVSERHLKNVTLHGIGSEARLIFTATGLTHGSQTFIDSFDALSIYLHMLLVERTCLPCPT